MTLNVDPAEFWAGVAKPAEGCWEWPHARMGGTHNYGQLRCDGKTIYAHRVSFELANGPIPDGLRVLHRCDNPPCIRPDHLRTGTAKANTDDMISKGRGRFTKHDGSANGSAKLTEGAVVEIRSRYAAGARQTALARDYGVTQANISMIVRGQAWKHVALTGIAGAA